MKLLFDILHPAHINFFKHQIRRLHHEGHEIILVCLKRGRVPQIMAREFPGYNITAIGHYGKGKMGLYLRTGLLRELALARFVSRMKPDAALGVAAFQVGALSRVFRFRSLGVYDDPEHKLNFNLSKRYLHRFIIPECLGVSGRNIVHFRGLKEWAYLSPTYFQPNPRALDAYGLKPRDYIFIRDVDVVSLNYRTQLVNNIALLYELGLSEYKVVLSLEKKKLRDNYPKWEILEEPVDDIHSLMYYSRLVISSGDSMAREGAELGVPSIYCGQRTMKANQALIDLRYLYQITEPKTIIDQLGNGVVELSKDEQDARRDYMLRDWDDPNEIVYQNVMELLEK